METRKISFGLRGNLPADVEQSREVPFTLSTYTRDRAGTVLNQANWDLKNFRKNPVVGYMHSPLDIPITGPDPDYVIGHDLNPHVEGSGKEGKLFGLVKFDPVEVNLLAEKVFRKVLFGTLRAVSVYFIEIGTGKWGTGDEEQGRENQTYYFSGQELLEWSIVHIPSNPDSVKAGKRFVRNSSRAAIAYTLDSLGSKFSTFQIKNMRIRDVLDLLNGKDLGIKTTNLQTVRKMISDPIAKKDLVNRIEKEQREFRLKYLNGDSSKPAQN